MIKFSIIVVCLNSGKRLEETIDSILCQVNASYEVIVKDGDSTDGSVERLKKRLKERESNGIKADNIRIVTQKDNGIYDAMNQAINYAQGEYLLFLNTGDLLYDDMTLENVSKEISVIEAKNDKKPDIVYGNMYHKAMQTVIYAAPQINDFTCYRNVPCHQTCFYSKKMFEDRNYKTQFHVRADYEHFLWCYYKKKADIFYIPVMTAVYEGGGYSETNENRKDSARQHREIVVYYMGKRKADKYRLIMLFTLAPIRSRLAENETFSRYYNAIKRKLYSIKNKSL